MSQIIFKQWFLFFITSFDNNIYAIYLKTTLLLFLLSKFVMLKFNIILVYTIVSFFKIFFPLSVCMLKYLVFQKKKKKIQHHLVCLNSVNWAFYFYNFLILLSTYYLIFLSIFYGWFGREKKLKDRKIRKKN